MLEKPAARPTHRLYNCARCRQQVVICRRCDRGNIYCFDGCAAEARRDSIRRASRRYQQGACGARNHARRQREYLARRRKVTHHGSPRRWIPLIMRAAIVAALLQLAPETAIAESHGLICHSCGAPSGDFLRQHFLHHSEVPG